jgi:hypothetical protein
VKRPRRVFPGYMAPQGPPRSWVSDGIPFTLDLSAVRSADLAELDQAPHTSRTAG